MGFVWSPGGCRPGFRSTLFSTSCLLSAPHVLATFAYCSAPPSGLLLSVLHLGLPIWVMGSSPFLCLLHRRCPSGSAFLWVFCMLGLGLSLLRPLTFSPGALSLAVPAAILSFGPVMRPVGVCSRFAPLVVATGRPSRLLVLRPSFPLGPRAGCPGPALDWSPPPAELLTFISSPPLFPLLPGAGVARYTLAWVVHSPAPSLGTPWFFSCPPPLFPLGPFLFVVSRYWGAGRGAGLLPCRLQFMCILASRLCSPWCAAGCIALLLRGPRATTPTR